MEMEEQRVTFLDDELFDRIGEVFLAHFHAVAGIAFDFASARQDIEALTCFEIVGEPIETSIPPECTAADGSPLTRHYVIPVRERAPQEESDHA